MDPPKVRGSTEMMRPPHENPDAVFGDDDAATNATRFRSLEGLVQRESPRRLTH
jgi:hypothetical protein